MKNYLAIGALILGLAISAFFYFHSSNPTIKNLPSSGESIVAFGDSLVYGTGSTEGKDFVTVLSDKIGKPIVNLGVPGNTTADGLSRVNDIEQYKPKVVLLLLGGNDYIRRQPEDETFQNLGVLITKIQSMGAVVVLLGVRGGVLSDHFESKYRALAKEQGALYVPNVLDGLFGDAHFMSDEVHPNDLGYALIAEKIYPVLLKALK